MSKLKIDIPSFAEEAGHTRYKVVHSLASAATGTPTAPVASATSATAATAASAASTAATTTGSRSNSTTTIAPAGRRGLRRGP